MNSLSKSEKIKNIIFCILGIALLSIVIGKISTMRGSSSLSFVVIIAFIILFVSFSKKINVFKLRKILYLSFFLRLIFTLVHTYAFRLPDSYADAFVFERLAWELAKSWLNGGITPNIGGSYIYSVLVAPVYYLFGRQPLLIQFVNVILGVLIVLMVYKLTFLITESMRSAYIASFIAAVFPTMNLYSAIILRENFVVFFSVLSVYYFIKWMKEPLFKYIILSFIPLLIGSLLHNGVVFIGAVYLFFYFIYDPRNKNYSFTIQSIFGLVLGVFAAVFFYNFMMLKLPSDVSMVFSAEYLGNVAASRAAGRTMYLQGMQPGSFVDLIIQTPIRIVYFLFSPFPWMIGSFNDLFALLDAFLYFILAIYSYKTLKEIKIGNKALALSLFLIIIIFVSVFAWGTSNFGTALRHRHKMVWLFISIASSEIAKSKIGRIWFKY